jgi:hypothetical protein
MEKLEPERHDVVRQKMHAGGGERVEGHEDGLKPFRNKRIYPRGALGLEALSFCRQGVIQLRRNVVVLPTEMLQADIQFCNESTQVSGPSFPHFS